MDIWEHDGSQVDPMVHDFDTQIHRGFLHRRPFQLSCSPASEEVLNKIPMMWLKQSFHLHYCLRGTLSHLRSYHHHTFFGD